MGLRYAVLLKRNAGFLYARAGLIDIAVEGTRLAGSAYMLEESDVTGFA
jgi:hypothetical protein